MHDPAEEQQRKVAGNSNVLHESSLLQTLPIAGNNSSFLQKDANSSFPRISGDTNSSDLISKNLQNSSQNTNLPNADSATSLTQVFARNTTKAGNTNDSLNQNSTNIMAVASSQSSYTKIDDKNPSLLHMPGSNAVTKNNTANLTDFQSTAETLQSNDKNTSTISADVTEIVDSGVNGMFFKGVKNSHNISQTQKSSENSSSDASAVVSMKSSLKNSTTGNMVTTNTSVIEQTNSSFSDMSISQKTTVNNLDHKLDSILNSRKNGSKESQVIESFGLNAGKIDR